MNQDTQGPISGEPASMPSRTGSTPRPDLAAVQRAVEPWAGHLPARRGARGLFRARWRWLALITLVVVAAAGMLSWSRTASYRAAADVLVQPRLFAAGTPPQAPDMGSEKAAAGSTVVLKIAARALGTTADHLSTGLSVTVPLNTHVLHISYSSADPEQARQRAQAVATAYVAYWLAQQPPLGVTTGGSRSAGILGTSVITPATRPAAPASPNHLVDVSIALIIGLLLGGGTAYLRDRLDDRLRGPHEFEENGGGPLLGLVPAARRTRARQVVARAPGSPGAASYRELCALLLRVAEQRGAKALLVTSPTGDAQTSVSANAAVTLAQAGRRVVLVYADLRRPHGHELFGIDQAPGLVDVLGGRASLADALRQTELPGLLVLPAGLPGGNTATTPRAAAWRELIRRLSASADLVVIDGPATLAGADIASTLEVADMVLAVGDALRTTRAQVRAAAAQLSHVPEKLIGCVLVNFGRRARLVTPPLSLVTGRNDHADAMPPPAGVDADADGFGEGERDDDSARWLPPRHNDAANGPNGTGPANGGRRPATTGKW
jgi:succinoglycan biosynthesis transport protein ExoP